MDFPFHELVKICMDSREGWTSTAPRGRGLHSSATRCVKNHLVLLVLNLLPPRLIWWSAAVELEIDCLQCLFTLSMPLVISYISLILSPSPPPIVFFPGQSALTHFSHGSWCRPLVRLAALSSAYPVQLSPFRDRENQNCALLKTAMRHGFIPWKKCLSVLFFPHNS